MTFGARDLECVAIDTNRAYVVSNIIDNRDYVVSANIYGGY